MKDVKINLCEQFNNFREVRRKAKQNKPKGPVDLKEARLVVKDWNKENRKP